MERVEPLQSDLHRVQAGAPSHPNLVPARHVQELGWWGNYKPSGKHAEQRAERITIQPPCEPNMLPVQERYRTILKKERFGGTCDILLMAKNKTGQQDMLVS